MKTIDMGLRWTEDAHEANYYEEKTCTFFLNLFKTEAIRLHTSATREETEKHRQCASHSEDFLIHVIYSVYFLHLFITANKSNQWRCMCTLFSTQTLDTIYYL